MERILFCVLTLGLISSSFGQNPTMYGDEFNGISPCQLSWNTPGAFQGFDGDDITNMTYDALDQAMVMDVKTNTDRHIPLFYTLNKGDDLDCKPGKGLVDLSGVSGYYSIRIKATEPMQIKMYLQEGNAASWDSTKISATPFVLNVTTSFQSHCSYDIDSMPLSGSTPLDLSKIGTVVFGLGKTDGVNFDQVDGQITIDYFRINSFHCGPGSIFELDEKVVNHKLFPNPTSNQFNVELLGNEKSTISLLNVNGKLIESKTSLDKEIVEFKNDLTKGLYFVQVQTKSGIQVSKLTVK